VLSPRQELILRKVVETYTATGIPVGSKALAVDPEIGAGPSTIRNELAMLEEQGLLAHPHTSAGRVPTDAGYRYFVDRLLHAPRKTRFELELVRREVDDAMRVAAETLSQVTSLLAVVTAPPIDTATIHHVEVLQLQPQVVMVVTITSTGGERRPSRSRSVVTKSSPSLSSTASVGAAVLRVARSRAIRSAAHSRVRIAAPSSLLSRPRAMRSRPVVWPSSSASTRCSSAVSRAPASFSLNLGLRS